MPTPRPVRPLDPEAIIWLGSSDPNAPLLVFLHGFGGNEHDWTPFADLLPSGVAGAALRAPLALGDRWAWAHFGEEGLSAFSASARGVLAWIESLGPRPIALVGWSQGAALAIHLARQRPTRFRVVSMGGGFVWELRPHRALAAAGLPVWYGIGSDDEVIPRRMVDSAERWLERHTDVELRRYPGAGHVLSRQVADDAISFALRHLE